MLDGREGRGSSSSKGGPAAAAAGAGAVQQVSVRMSGAEAGSARQSPRRGAGVGSRGVPSRTSSYEAAKSGQVGQNVTPVFNDPTEAASSSGSFWGWLPWQSASDSPYGNEAPPPLAPGVLPDVELADFQRYLASVRERFRRFEDARGSLPAGGAHPPQQPQQGGEANKQGEGLLAALEQVPAVFFHEDFSLERPETYEQVNPDDTEDGRMDKVEELTAFMDVIETNLLKEIGVRSGSFFEATGLIQDLETTIRLASRQIAELRAGVAALDEEMLQTAVQVQGLQRRRRNLLAAVEKLRAVERVVNAQTALQLLLPQGDFTAVLDVLEDLHLAQSQGQLDGLAAFRHLAEQTAEVEATVGELMAGELLQAASLTEAVDRAVVAAAALGNADGRAGEPTPELDEGVQALVLGLVRTGQLAPVLGSLRAAYAVETKRGVRVLVERLLPELLSGDEKQRLEEEEQGKGGGAAAESLQGRLQQLSPGAFLKLLGAVLGVVNACLGRAAAVRDLVGRVLEEGRVLRSKQAGAVRECAEAVHAVAEAAVGRWVKLLAARLPVVSEATVPQLCELSAACEDLCAAAEAHGSSRGSAAVRGAIQHQARAFLDGVHKRRMAALAALLDKETWVAAPPAARHRAALAALVSRSAEEEDNKEGEEAPGNGQALVLRGQRFHLVGAALEMLEMLEEYRGFTAAVPGFGAEVAHRVVELVKAFNNRSCQLVLGAGAMQAAGLKSITAKHLALSCQCLGFFIALQPDVREVFSDGAHMAEHRKALLAPEMGRLLQDLSLHRDEIHSKLVAIMRERLLAGARQLPQAAEKWGAGAPSEGPWRLRPTPFAEGTAKQLRVLRTVLVPLLGADDLAAVFGRISGLFGATLAESYARLEDPGATAGAPTAWEAQRRADAVLLLQTLQELPVARPDLQANLQPLYNFCKQRYGAAPEIGDPHQHQPRRPSHTPDKDTDKDGRQDAAEASNEPGPAGGVAEPPASERAPPQAAADAPEAGNAAGAAPGLATAADADLQLGVPAQDVPAVAADAAAAAAGIADDVGEDGPKVVGAASLGGDEADEQGELAPGRDETSNRAAHEDEDEDAGTSRGSDESKVQGQAEGAPGAAPEDDAIPGGSEEAEGAPGKEAPSQGAAPSAVAAAEADGWGAANGDDGWEGQDR